MILGVIPARGGSKGIPDKNIRLLAGKPLIAYTIEAGRASRLLTDVVVTTDSERIAEIAVALGAKVPFLRPKELATDDAKTIDAVRHAVLEYERRNDLLVDVVVLLQPTSPLRTAKDIDTAIVQYRESPDARSLVSCYDATSVHPAIMYRQGRKGRLQAYLKGAVALRRQKFEQLYVRNGAIYIAGRELVVGENLMYDDNPHGYVMPRERSINIDEPFDLEIAACLLAKGLPTP